MSENFLSCCNVSFKYANKNYFILKDINFNLKSQDFRLIIGPSGSGKTTLLKVLNGTLAPSLGSVSINKRIFYMPQSEDFNIEFPISLSSFVTLGALSKNKFFINKEDIKRSDSYLKDLNLYNLKDLRINQLSGGQIKRAVFARGLMSNASIFILDEPFSNLDKRSSLETFKYIRNVAKDKNISILIVTHNLDHIKKEYINNSDLFYLDGGALKNINICSAHSCFECSDEISLKSINNCNSCNNSVVAC